MLLTIALILVAIIVLAALELWFFWALGEGHDGRRPRLWPSALENGAKRPRSSPIRRRSSSLAPWTNRLPRGEYHA